LRYRPPFLVVPYRVNCHGILEAQLPNKCPLWKEGEVGCSLVRKGYRQRKTIPGYRLCIFRCRHHGKKFTAYPPGYAPFLRKPLTLLSPNGSVVQLDSPSDFFGGTLFQAVMDAAHGKRWPIRKTKNKEQCLLTQRRHLGRLASLMGVATHLNAKECEWIGATLGVPGLVIHDGQQSLDQDPSFQNLTSNVWLLARNLTNRWRDYQRLLASGYLNGHWGRPHVYSRSLMHSGFQRLESECSRAGPDIVNYLELKPIVEVWRAKESDAKQGYPP